jgi:glyoxalase family protein
VEQAELHPTPFVDRQYFNAIYFREAGGILFEIATDTPGFDVDEPFESLGEKLMLPEWYEKRREAIERNLLPFEVRVLEGDE